MFYILPGLVSMLFSFYSLIFVFIHIIGCFQELPFTSNSYNFRLGASIATAFAKAPHAFILSGFSLMVAIQFICFGLLSLQNKRYFEELYHLGTMTSMRGRDHNKIKKI
jgi:hypothetical protein